MSHPHIPVIARMLPSHSSQFICEDIPQDRDREVFELDARNGKIVLRGSSGVALASTFNWYLRHVAKLQVSNRGDQLALPATLPLPAAKIRKVSPYKVVNHLNNVTFSYTTAFWSWERWEREIDFMAMCGVKNPLMIGGNEKVWQNVLRKAGFSEKDIAAYIASCAYVPFMLMGNAEGEGGPVPQRLIEAEAELARNILERMRAYGMEPVLQGFCGIVPSTTSKYLPEAKILDQGTWAGGYRRPHILSPLDPQFAALAESWYAEHFRLYGKARYYGGDLFHEGGQHGDLDLAACARAVQCAMRKDNPDAVWVLQGWNNNPPKALLEGTDPDHVLIQLFVSYPQKISVQDFSGRPWTLCMINTFGGHETLGGSLRVLASLPSGLLGRENHNNVGIGLCDEGLDSNPAVYELAADMVWEREDQDPRSWARGFALRRYGAEDPAAVRFWELMATELLGFEAENLLCARPGFNQRRVSTWGDSTLRHDLGVMLEAGRLLFSCSARFRSLPTYRGDCIEAMRQLFQDHGTQLYARFSAAHTRGDAAEFATLSAEFLELLADCDRLFSAGEYTLLGTWIAEARAKGADEAEKKLLERNARQQITRWTPGVSDLNDYSYRQWGGLFRDYYLPRWRKFFRNVERSFRDPKVSTVYEPDADEAAWINAAASAYPTRPESDAVDTAEGLFRKYENRFAVSVDHWRKSQAEDSLWVWSLADSEATEQVLQWDVTRKLRELGAGAYSVRVENQRGNHAVLVRKVELLEKTAMAVNDALVASDGRETPPLWPARENAYTLDAKNIRDETQYILRISVAGCGGNNAHGRIVITRRQA